MLQCKEKNFIYEPGTKKCVDIKTITEQNFCANRANDDWVYPWNCHKFVKCYFGVTHVLDCQLPKLIFNPTNDQCNYPGKYPCKQVEQQETPKSKGMELNSVFLLTLPSNPSF